jgi:hypothetical protein
MIELGQIIDGYRSLVQQNPVIALFHGELSAKTL